MTVKIALFAPDGRMGQAISAAAPELGAEIVEKGDPADVLVDFSSPAALGDSITMAKRFELPLVVGTTGLGDEQQAMIDEAATEIAILQAANTSLGVALLSDLVERAAKVLGPDGWDVEIVETHHRHKADAPSGTALHLGAAAKRGRGKDMPEERARNGTGLIREAGAIGYAALRGGTVAGDHDVLFLGEHERLILSHRAENRAIFARGAIAAAKYMKLKPAGLYSMHDVISA
ncbi:4-hydroxy-tetrahydrodipicolinate reductase [Sphingomicrobium flavum]|uniref:4-hydroxy-tetrahydrodipicolinate reductase n=1 Tax=Sphingomicrobium flavum TaxID=1229164 RepID=UPI0021AD803B|nr:4-hydroxy-tetrahydrodipicolinate reductase [Sphingomicrobium flavum]